MTNQVVEKSDRSNIAGNITLSKSQPKNTVTWKNNKYQRQVWKNSLMWYFIKGHSTITGQGVCAFAQGTYCWKHELQ